MGGLQRRKIYTSKRPSSLAMHKVHVRHGPSCYFVYSKNEFVYYKWTCTAISTHTSEIVFPLVNIITSSVQVSIYLPSLKLLKNITDRMKTMSNYLVRASSCCLYVHCPIPQLLVRAAVASMLIALSPNYWLEQLLPLRSLPYSPTTWLELAAVASMFIALFPNYLVRASSCCLYVHSTLHLQCLIASSCFEHESPVETSNS